jgi:hypothetical protein
MESMIVLFLNGPLNLVWMLNCHEFLTRGGPKFRGFGLVYGFANAVYWRSLENRIEGIDTTVAQGMMGGWGDAAAAGRSCSFEKFHL